MSTGALLAVRNFCGDGVALVGVVGEPLHGQVQVGPVEARDDLPVVVQTQPGDDVATHRRCRGGGQRDHGGVPEPVDHLAEPQVVGSEIVAPGRNAVRFVHDEQRHAESGQRVDPLVVGQLLR